MPKGTTTFREEADRRLIDAYELMIKLGLRNRSAIWKRVETGRLPRPVYSRARTIALWDLDEVEEFTSENGGR
jgi:predicted DNA-binding transcriptional regulator AlpA